jgi:ABC-type transporter Mla subunit MlaD
MDETTSSGAASQPLAQNEYVQELFSILRNNDRDTTGLSALLGHVSEMESFVKRAEDKIADMKSQLSEMKEVQNHPVKTALNNAIKNLENKVAEIKVQLAELKHNIVEGCKNAVAAFKEKGIAALDKLASFFHINNGLKAIDKGATENAQSCDKAVAKINEFSSQYHEAGRAIKNMARMIIGKDPVDAKKEAGAIAKALAAPYMAEKALMLQISKSASAMSQKLEQLETRAADNREHRARETKPQSLLGEVREAQQIVDQRKREMPVPERAKTIGAVEV